ncbi:YdcF family protein [Candidatus Saccharibacteria bacterium]|nr:YdcF family protein [Candidatus Saccharibacteria bacterium]
MIRGLIIGLAGFATITFILGYYLQPDDLAGCPESPNLSSNCQRVDAVEAISGGDTDARVNQAINLYKQGWADKLIFSGAAEDKTGPSNAAAMKKIALNRGVSESDIYLDETSATTKQNAENSGKIFEEHSIKSIILVTSGYHQRRAFLEFSKVLKNIKILNHPTANDKDWSSTYWWIAPHGWWLALSEIIKIGIFHVMGIWS